MSNTKTKSASSVYLYLQRLGKSMMLPICVMPICGILMGIGYLLCPQAIQDGPVEGVAGFIGYYLVMASNAVIGNINWLFVIGVAVGMSDDNHGAVCLAALAGWLILVKLLADPQVTGPIYSFLGITTTDITNLAFKKIENPFIAILIGSVTAGCYNKFKGLKLPDFLAFFSGRRFIIIIVSLISLAIAFVLVFVWPLVYAGLVALGNGIKQLGGIGAGIYAFLNRLLIPTGMHHALNNVFWFDTIGMGDLTNFWAGKTSADVGWDLGMYMSGFFPCMMFGVPGAALAMIQMSKDKKYAKSLLISTALCAFLCGVTEPFEFSFMFLAFPLYIVYAFLYGVFTVITYYVGFRAGFSFSAGAVDLLFSASLPAAQKTWLIIPLGIGAFVVFYLVFRFMIKIFDMKTPGRNIEDLKAIASKQLVTTGNKYYDMAFNVFNALGGKSNIVSVDCCATRLRLELKDTSSVDETAIKSAGALGYKKLSDSSCQVIIGTTVQQVCDELKNILSGKTVSQKIKHGQTILRAKIKSLLPATPEKQSIEINGDSFEFIVTDQNGIHARPAGEIVKIAKNYKSAVTISCGEKTADAKSIIGIMSLGAVKGSALTVSAVGEDGADALNAVAEFLKKNL